LLNFRQIRLLWFTYAREYRKCKERDGSRVTEVERKRNPDHWEYWQTRVDAEECTAAFQTAIATLIEDASEITLALYVIFCRGEQESIIGQLSLRSSLLLRFTLATYGAIGL